MLYLTFFFFKQKTAYDMRISDWNSAVCSSDLDAGASRGRAFANALAPADFTGKWTGLAAPDRRLTAVTAAELATPAEEAQAIALALRAALEEPGKARKSGVSGESVSVRVDLGGRRIIKKQIKMRITHTYIVATRESLSYKNK